MSLLINQTGTIGVIYNAVNYNVTGSEFLTMLLLILLCILFVALFRMPLEMSAFLVMPMLIVMMSFNSNLLAVGGAALVYIGVLIAKNWFLR